MRGLLRLALFITCAILWIVAVSLFISAMQEYMK